MRTYTTKSVENDKLLDAHILVTDHMTNPKMSIDQELINLLSVEEECNALLQNITNNEPFENLIDQQEDKHKLLQIEHAQFTDFIPNNFNHVQDIEQEADNLLTDERLSATNFAIPNTYSINYNVDSHVDSSKHLNQIEKFEDPKNVLTDEHHSQLFKIENNANLSAIDQTAPVFACDICDKEFKRNYDAIVHKKTHDKPSFECKFCSKRFTQKSHLSVHERRHLSEFVAFCKPCNKGFITKSSYKNHLNVKHNGNAHLCPICGSKLSTRSALKDHMKTHDDRRERSEICEICGKTFLNVRNLRGHLKTHGTLQNYSCNICGKVLSDKKTLDVHLRNHKGEKPMKCDVCQKGFASKNYLRLHLRTHSGIKPYVCTYCDKSFSQKSSLTIHSRYHTGDRPYVCSLCAKCFVTKTHLNGHMKTHDVYKNENELFTTNCNGNKNI